MKEFMLIFRNDKNMEMPTGDRMQEVMQEWQNWMKGIAEKGKFSGTNRLTPEGGKTLKPGGIITDGPYAEVKEVVGGYLVVTADSIEEAVELAKGCPGLNYGGNVEVRTVMPMPIEIKASAAVN